MLQKQILIVITTVSLLALPLLLFTGSTVSADEKNMTPTPTRAQRCGDVDTAIIGGDICNGVNANSTSVNNSAIMVILRWVIRIMAAGAAILAIGGIVYGAILYTSAAGSAEQIKKSKDVLFNVAIGIVAFALMWAFLEWLIPGGVL